MFTKKIAIILLLIDGLVVFLNKKFFDSNVYVREITTIVGIIIMIYLYKIWRYIDED